MIITTIIISVFIYLCVGCLLSFAVYDGGKHSLSIVLFYPFCITFFCILAGIALLSENNSN